MKRRDSLKALTLGSIGAATLGTGSAMAEAPVSPPDEIKVPGGRLKHEAIRDAKIQKEKFLTITELAIVTILADIIIPADAKSGSASQAGVPAFIEFIVKDMPQHQVPLRGGISWLNLESSKRFKKGFNLLTKKQQMEIVDDIAFTDNVKPGMSQGVAFFNLMRNLTATGYYTSQIGIKDLGYAGNTPNVWEGVPADVLAKYGVSYDD